MLEGKSSSHWGKRGGKVYTKVVKDCSRESKYSFSTCKIMEESTVFTDGWKSYHGLGFIKDFNTIESIIQRTNLLSREKNHINGNTVLGITKTECKKSEELEKTTYMIHLKECLEITETKIFTKFVENTLLKIRYSRKDPNQIIEQPCVVRFKNNVGKGQTINIWLLYPILIRGNQLTMISACIVVIHLPWPLFIVWERSCTLWQEA